MINDSSLGLWLLTLLHQGEANAIKGNELRQLAGFDSIRELRAEVERERHAGAVILTSQRGYFLPELDGLGQLTQQGYLDTMRFCRIQQAKGYGTLRSAQSAERALQQYPMFNYSMWEGDACGEA